MPRVRFEYSQFWWGQVLWILFHRLCALYPQAPSEFLQRHMVRLVLLLEHLLPCEGCSLNFPAEVQRAAVPLEVAVRSRSTLVTWFLDLHNAVNARLGKPAWDEARLYASMEDICPDAEGGATWERCRMPPATAADELPESEVFYFILAILSGFPAEGELPEGKAAAMTQWLTALYWVLRACDSVTGDAVGRGVLALTRSLDLTADLGMAAGELHAGAEVVVEPETVFAAHMTTRDSAMAMLVAMWNEVRRGVSPGLPPVEQAALEEEYCMFSACGVSDEEHPESSLAGVQALEGEAPQAPLPSPPLPEKMDEVIAGERRWRQALGPYIILMVTVVALILGMVVWLASNRPSWPTHPVPLPSRRLRTRV